MAVQLKDRIRTECQATGTGDIVFGADKPGFLNWNQVTNNETVYYCIEQGDFFEIGYGNKTATGIVRNPIINHNGNTTKWNIGAGAEVFLTVPADKFPHYDVAGNLRADTRNIYASNFIGNASNMTGLPTLTSLGIPNHNLVTVDGSGEVSATSFTGDGSGLTNLPLNGYATEGWVTGQGYLTTETDPTVPAHVKAITTTQVTNWDTAHSWGNHASYDYATKAYVDAYPIQNLDPLP